MTPGTASAQAHGPAAIRVADFTTLPNLVSLARIVGVSAAVLLYFAGYPASRTTSMATSRAG